MSWQTVKLGDVCDFVRGPFGGSLKKEYFVEDGYAVYEQQHAIYNQFNSIRYFVNQKKFDELKRFELKYGDLIMSCSGTMGKVAIVPKDIKKGLINQALLKLTPAPNLSIFFLKQYMESKEFQLALSNETHGAAIKNVASVGILKNLKIKLPPLEEQQRIAAILDKTELIKSKRELAIEKLDELAQSIFVDMFGDLVTNLKNFDVIELSEICDLQNGFAFKSDDYIDSSNILNCRMSNIRPNGEFNILYHPKYLPNHYADKYSSFLLNDGDVIIAMTDMAGEPKILGVPTIVDTQGYKLLLNQRVGKLIFKNQQPLSIKYLKYALSQPYVKQYYRKFASGGVQINLGKKDLLSVKILLPSYANQKAFDDLVSKLFSNKEKHVEASQKMDMISQSIKSRAFTGLL